MSATHHRGQARIVFLLAAAGALVWASTVAPPAVAAPGDLTRVDVSTSGTGGGGQGDSVFGLAVSADGRYVAFGSTASDLVSGDTNGTGDVFVRDRVSGSTTRVSVATDESQGTGRSNYPSISADGRYVAFESAAADLVPGDTNGAWDVFVRDRQTGTTTRVSVAGDGTQAYGNSSSPSISGNGRHVAFASDATTLVPGDTNGASDVFVRDTMKGKTARISLTATGGQASGRSFDPSISADGRYVAFASDASNLVQDANGSSDVFVRDTVAGRLLVVSYDVTGNVLAGRSIEPSISGDGRFVAFTSSAPAIVAGDTNGHADVFVRDMVASLVSSSTTRVSVKTDGTQFEGAAEPSVSRDGRSVAFLAQTLDADAPTFTPFVRDRLTGTTARASLTTPGQAYGVGDDDPTISGDGRFVAFVATEYAECGDPCGTVYPAVGHAYVAERAVPTVTVASDSFSRTVAGGWGTAPKGGSYSLIGPSGFSVSGGVGRITAATAGADRRALLGSAVAGDSTASVIISTDKNARGTGQYAWLSVRDTGTSAYRTVVLFKPDGTVRLILRRVVDGTTTDLAAATIPGLTYTPGARLALKMRTIGGVPTTVRAKIWTVGKAEPSAWQLSKADYSPALASGGVDLGTYQSLGATNLPVTQSFDNLSVTTP